MAGVHRATAGRWKRREGRVPPSTGHCTASQRSIPLDGTLILVMFMLFMVMATEVVVWCSILFNLVTKTLED